MPCLDATALETDPEGMDFLRAVLKPDAGKARPRPAFVKPTMPSAAVLGPEQAQPAAVALPAVVARPPIARRTRVAACHRPLAG